MFEGGAELRDLPLTLDPKARDDLRRALIRDSADRDAIAMQLMLYRDENGQRWAQRHRLPDDVARCRRTVVRLLGEIDSVQF